ncbi:hypothetical protein [Butyrivibrio sp. FC2001]|nr:hypothetical protein [Butyrivibrio sp. FC2001]
MRKNISKIGIAFTFAAMLAMTGCGDDEIDTPVSDALAGIIDSLKFN